jgi:amino acid transporter
MTTATVTPSVPRPELRRDLGLASATALVAGECIAVGIFLTPAGMAKALRSPLVTPIVFLTFIALTLLVLALHAARESALGTVVVLAGVPVYEVFQRRRTEPVTSRVPAEGTST